MLRFLVVAAIAFLTLLSSFAQAQRGNDLVFVNGFEFSPGADCLNMPDVDGDNLLDPECAPEFVPPDPASVAPPLDRTVVTAFTTAVEYLYQGPNPIQRGLQESRLESWRVASLKGIVRDTAGNPLPGVLVRVLYHPEFGYTYTRANGEYDLVVNGGLALTVDLRKSGFIPSQRVIKPGWLDWFWAEDVQLVAYDTAVTQVSFGPNAPAQSHFATTQTDELGPRKTALFFGASTEANLIQRTGGMAAASSLAIRATEYSVGAEGTERMPATLPPSTAYTYAVELSGDEAVFESARGISFSKPVSLYVENYYGFPVGQAVPVGYYDPIIGSWLPSKNGVILEILGINNGIAIIDVNGAGTPATQLELDNLGIDVDEQMFLASNYNPGEELWRSRVTHFSPWDCNFPYFFPPGAEEPQDPGTDSDNPDGEDPGVQDPDPPEGDGDEDPDRPDNDDDASDEKPEVDCGSIINCEAGILSEMVPVAGAPFTLVYSSDRATNTRALRIRVPATYDELPDGLAEVRVEVLIGGRKYETRVNPPTPNFVYTVDWDGKDFAGREWQGSFDTTVRVGFVYPLVYVNGPGPTDEDFGSFSAGTQFQSLRNERLGILWRSWSSHGSWRDQSLQPKIFDARALQLGGWGISQHHVYDPRTRTVYYGHGGQRSVSLPFSNGISTLERLSRFSEFSSGAFEESLRFMDDGTIYRLTLGTIGTIAPRGPTDQIRDRIAWRRPGMDEFELIAQSCPPSVDTEDLCTEGTTSAWNAQHAAWFDVDADGAIYVQTRNELDESTGIKRFVGAQFTHFYPREGDVDQCESIQESTFYERQLYLACAEPGQPFSLILVWPDGRATLIGGAIGRQISGASSASSMTTDQDGNLIIALPDANRIIRFGLGAEPVVIAGTGVGSNSVDGTLAAGATVNSPYLLDRTPDGRIVFAERKDGRGMVREIRPNGEIFTLIGGGTEPFFGDAPAFGMNAAIDPESLQMLPDGTVAFSQSGSYYSSRMSTFEFDLTPELQRSQGPSGQPVFRVPSEDAAFVYIFDLSGRHLRTVNGTTGGTILEFHYDDSGLIVGIEDGDGEMTTITRQSLTQIATPHGVTTDLHIGSDGLLSSVVSPVGQVWQFDYDEGFVPGAMTEFRDPNGNLTTFDWSPQGRLEGETNGEGGGWQIVRQRWLSSDGNAYNTSLQRSGGGDYAKRVTRRTTTNGGVYKTVRRPDGTSRENVRTAEGTEAAQNDEGNIITARYGPDPRFGMLSPIMRQMEENWSPSGPIREHFFSRTADLIGTDPTIGSYDLTETLVINNRTATRSYDAASRTWTMRSPAGRESTVTIDELGRTTQVQIAGLLPTTTMRDGRGRVVSVEQGTRVTTYGYDANSWPNSVVDAALREYQYLNDAIGRQLVVTHPDQRTAEFDYDAGSNVVGFTPPGRDAHTFRFNRVNDMDQYLPPSPTGAAGNWATSFVYDDQQRLHRVERPDGRSIELNYFDGTRPSTITVSAGNYTYQYDGSRVANIETPDGVVLSRAYEGPWNSTEIISGIWNEPKTITFLHDLSNGKTNGWLAGMQVTGGEDVEFIRDLDGLPTRATIGTDRLNVRYKAMNVLVDGTDIGVISDEPTWSEYGELQAYEATLTSGTLLYGVSFDVRDNAGRIESKTETIQGVQTQYEYTYDIAGRLEQVSENGILVRTYSYDSNSNRLSVVTPGGTTSATYDAQDRMVTYGSATYAYNAAGDTVAKTVAGGAVTSYDHDEFGNLQGVSLPDGRTIEYLVDGRNRRVAKKIDGILTQGFLYLNQLEPIAELDGNGQVVSQFIYAERYSVPSLMRRAGQTYRIISDYQGSVRLVVEVSTGTVVQRLDYDEFGRITLDTNPGFQPFAYVGGLYDRDTSLMKFGARDYDPETGRWLTRDLQLFAGESRNMYVYVSNDSVNKIDLWGNAEISYLACAWNNKGAGVMAGYNYNTEAIDVVFHGYQEWADVPISDEFGTIELVTGEEGEGCDLGKISYTDIIEDIKNPLWYNEDRVINLVGCGSVGLAARIASELPNPVIGYSHLIRLETHHWEGRTSETYLNTLQSQVWTWQ